MIPLPDSIRRWLTRVLLVALLVACCGLGVWVYILSLRAERATREQQRAEAARIRAEGLVVSERASLSQLRDEVSRLARGSASIEKQLAAMKRAAPRARPELAVQGRGKTVRVDCPAPTEPTRGEASSHVSSHPSLEFEPRFDLIGIRTQLGTHVLLGEIYGVRPGTEERLWESPVRADLTRYWRAETPRARWLVGPTVGLSDGRMVVGAAVLGPAARPRRFEMRPFAIGLAGGGGWTLVGGVIVSED